MSHRPIGAASAVFRRLLLISALYVALPSLANAQVPDATLIASPTSVNIGQSVSVAYSVATTSFRSGDDIIMVNAATRRIVTYQNVGTAKTGTKTFTTKDPGSYYFQYRASISRSPIFATSSTVTFSIPDSSLYTLSPNKTVIDSGEPLVVSYAGPAYAHQYGDNIVVIDTATNRQVAYQSLGTSPSGTKTFVLRAPGTYRLEYKLSITGTPVVKTAGPITVKIPDSSLYTLAPNITVAEINQPIEVSFSGPTYAHQYGDDIVLYETATGKIVSSQNVGATASGKKTFQIGTTGTYAFAYRMNISGTPIVKRSAEVSVVYVNLSRISNYPLRQGPVIALGDSITFGRDATAGNDYVSLLSARLGEPIQNAGVSGDTTADALARLDRDVLSKDPRLVIVFLGGNDFLQKVPTDTIFANLATIIDRIEADGAAVLVLGYKDYFLVNYDARYRDLAWQKGAAYTPDVMGGILGNPLLTTDLVHPRNTGHRIIADRVEPYLRILLGR